MTRFAPLWLQAQTYPASVDRRLMGALWPTARSTGAAASPGAAGGMNVDAAPGQVAVPAANGTGTVLCAWDAPETTALDPAPPSGSNRTDLVYIQARGNDLDGGTDNDFLLAHLTGAIGGAVPAVPANAVALAQVAVTGGAAAVTAAMITDRRPGNLAVPTAGRVASLRGPASQFNQPTGTGTVIQLGPVTLAPGYYAVQARCQAQAAGAIPSFCTAQLLDTAGLVTGNVYLFSLAQAQLGNPGTIFQGSATTELHPTVATTSTFRISLLVGASSGSVQVPAGSAEMLLLRTG
jgi:hypothetical protein